jgi:hypothetical protein
LGKRNVKQQVKAPFCEKKTALLLVFNKVYLFEIAVLGELPHPI